MKKILIKIACIFAILSYHAIAEAQDRYAAKIIISESNNEQASTRKFFNKQYSDSLSFYSHCRQYLSALHEASFLAARIDSIRINNDTLKAWYFAGPRYQFSHMQLKYDQWTETEAIHSDKKLQKKEVHLEDYLNQREKILQKLENSGYPFAAIRLENIRIKKDIIQAQLAVYPGTRYLIDSLIIKSDKNTGEPFIRTYLDIKKGDLYNEQKLREINKRIEELEFIKSLRPAELEFYDSTAGVFVYLDNQNANRFNGVLGIAPRHSVYEKVQITGELNILMNNIFRQGEKIALEWKNPEKSTQKLNTSFSIPYIYRFPLGATLGLELYKKDSSYLNLEFNGGLHYILSGQNYLRACYRVKTSRLLRSFSDPALNNTDIELWGLEYNFNNFDYALNPRKGIHINTMASAGNSRASDTEDAGSMHIEYKHHINIHLPLGRQSTLKLSSSVGYMHSKEIFSNNLFRIGGTNRLRGFDEDRFLVNLYGVFSLEYRLLLDRQSAILAFIDGAYIENSYHNEFHDWPISFGFGGFIPVGSGILSLSYAIGKTRDQSFSIQSGKIHIGLINRF